MYYIFLFILSVLPVIILGKYVYNKDRNKEPKKVLTKLFLFGICSVIITLLLTNVLEIFFPFLKLEMEDLDFTHKFIYIFIGVALIEELSKFIFAYTMFKSKHFDEFFDMIVYATFVSLGFACFENILYVFEQGAFVGIIRALLSVPGHACYGVFMGYYLSIAKLNIINDRKDLFKKNLLKSLLIPTMLHGIYDFCILSGYYYLLLIFIVFIVLLYRNTLQKIKDARGINKKLNGEVVEYCYKCGSVKSGTYCANCGTKLE